MVGSILNPEKTTDGSGFGTWDVTSDGVKSLKIEGLPATRQVQLFWKYNLETPIAAKDASGNDVIITSDQKVALLDSDAGVKWNVMLQVLTEGTPVVDIATPGFHVGF